MKTHRLPVDLYVFQCLDCGKLTTRHELELRAFWANSCAYCGGWVEPQADWKSILVLLISYDLMTVESLDAAIKERATETQRLSKSVWLAQTDEDVGAFGRGLAQHLDPQDRMIVVRVHNMSSVNGWLPPAMWEWIKERVDNDVYGYTRD